MKPCIIYDETQIAILDLVLEFIFQIVKKPKEINIVYVQFL